MQLAAQSSFKGKSDRSKYSKAALLCKNIEKIRKSYKKDLRSKDRETRQLATAVWVIDRLALRVGGEKDTDEEADTVGCCSLRVEHVKFDPNQEGGDNKEIELEFLGKDSMLYKQTIDFGAAMYNENDGMGEQVYDNFKAFCKGKKKDEDIFEKINPTLLNNHLKQVRGRCWTIVVSGQLSHALVCCSSWTVSLPKCFVRTMLPRRFKRSCANTRRRRCGRD